MGKLFFTLGLLFGLCGSNDSFANENPDNQICSAEMNDDVNNSLAKIDWKGGFFTGEMGGVLITTSLGDNQIMSLWVREKKASKPQGMFSFVDLSSGKNQYMRYYMASGLSVGVTCKWQ